MRRRPAYPKAGDRVRLEIPLPKGATSRARRGTVLERSCGRSGSLRIRWDAEAKRPAVETWLADAAWHWSQSNLRVLPTGAGPEPASSSMPAGEVHEGDELWSGGSTKARTPRPPAGPGTTAGAAFDEWEAALAAEKAPTADDSWESVLAGALGLPGSEPPVASQPAPPPKVPVTPVRFSDPAPAPAPRPAIAPKPAPAPAPEPVAAAPVATATKVWTGDDILPNRGSKKGRRRF